MKRLLLTLLKITVVSVPLTWIWMEWGREAYGELFIRLSLPIYGLFGLTTVIPEGARDRFINYLPFLILMIITPRMSLKRRVIGTLTGFVLLFLGHVAFAYIASTAINPDNTINSRGFRKIVAANGFSDAAPFILWVVIAKQWVWESAGRLFSAPTEAPPANVPDEI
jgi:hypothetical protein